MHPIKFVSLSPDNIMVMLKSIIYSFLIGTYGSLIYKVDFDATSGIIKVTDTLQVPNASYVTGSGGSIYTFSESGADSKVYSFKDGVRSEVLCPGDNPCYITLSPDRNYLLTADYTGGSVSVYSLLEGDVVTRIQKLQFHGSGPVTRRQESSHIHQVKVLPQVDGVEGKWILAPDLGSDKIRVLRYSGSNVAGGNKDAVGNMVPLEHISDIQFPAGSGPRHIEFDMKRQMMYCIAELSGEVFAFRMGVKKGVPAFELVQSTVADEYNTGGSGDIHMHPSGNYLYTSHRLKNDGLAVFSIGKEGLLKKIGYVPTKEHPRNFLVTPCGKYIIVASKNEFTIQVFEVGEDGVPVATESVLDFSPDAPVSVVLNH